MTKQTEETLIKWAQTFIGQVHKPGSDSTVKEEGKVVRFELGKQRTGVYFYLDNNGWFYKQYA